MQDEVAVDARVPHRDDDGHAVDGHGEVADEFGVEEVVQGEAVARLPVGQAAEAARGRDCCGVHEAIMESVLD
ncbi:hypothetical protein GCM10025870_17360 [Agromyces marinus]|uniref:Uncharacterized protein n=1 Tax=Agromyces marinus TaxID=1389020 RepID=A0ABN6YFF6_9MICO|nr:hypothetical protein [Agromyces marinus]BDZ54663.1 hypothetical protein GCM10025870_17360 [Agromyces marinus]